MITLRQRQDGSWIVTEHHSATHQTAWSPAKGDEARVIAKAMARHSAERHLKINLPA